MPGPERDPGLTLSQPALPSPAVAERRSELLRGERRESFHVPALPPR
jgi:hypothetical protein